MKFRPGIHPALSLISAHSCGDRDTSGGESFGMRDAAGAGLWVPGIAARGQARLLLLCFKGKFILGQGLSGKMKHGGRV